MSEESGGQVQTLSMRMTAGLRGRLEAMREVASLRRGGAPVTTSEIAKGLLESARDETLELAELQAKPTEALLSIRRKAEHEQSLTHAEWMLVARYVQIGTESFRKIPICGESWAGLLEAFLALYSVRLNGPDRNGYYLANFAGQTLSREGATEREVRTAVGNLLEQARGGARIHPSIGRALYGLLAGERFAGVEAIHGALMPYWPVLWRVAARGHYEQQKSPIHDDRTVDETKGWHEEAKAPGHRQGIPLFRAGEYTLSLLDSIEGKTLPLCLSLPGSHAPVYTMAQYPKIVEFRAMLEGLRRRTVDSRGNVRGEDLWDGDSFFGYVVAGSSAEGYWFRDGPISLGFPVAGWEQVRELFRQAWEHPEVIRIWNRLEQEYGEL